MVNIHKLRHNHINVTTTKNTAVHLVMKTEENKETGNARARTFSCSPVQVLNGS